MKKIIGVSLALMIINLVVNISSIAQSTAFPESILTNNPSGSDFHLFTNQNKAKILVDDKDLNTVRLVAGLFADDVERVTGIRPDIVNDIKMAGSQCIIIGSIESGGIVKKLITKGIIDVSGIKGQWEACLTQVVDNPFPGIEKALVIAGSDRRGTAYGVFELSKQIGVSPWYWFADVPVTKRDFISIKSGKYVLGSPSVQYRGIFINDEMWGLRPWAMYTYAPEEGKGIGPSTHKRIFELLLRLKANLLWPAMHQKTKPFNFYEENKVVADEYAIIMGSSHIEPMLRNNIGGAEWDTEYPGEAWDYIENKDKIYKYWEDRVKANGRYENMYTIGKRGKDDEAGSDISVPVLEQIFHDQRDILRKWVNRDVTKVPQVLIPYTEVLGLYNQGLNVPEDVIICWPDDNFGNIRQLPDDKERQRSGGSGVYYHFQWLNGATTAYPWTCTTPIGLTWTEMKRAYDFGVKKLWVVNVGDIKPAEINIEYFMQLAWDINSWNQNTSTEFLRSWAAREYGGEYSSEIASIMQKHYELGYARRPESMVMWNGGKQELNWEWFSLDNYDDEAQRRIDDYTDIVYRVDDVYNSLPFEMKDAFFQTVVYNAKGTALQNIKVLNAQKSYSYGTQNRSSAASYAAKAQMAENEIYKMIDHYSRGLLVAGDKWDHMASLPGPWGGQWHQWDMPPLSCYSGEGVPHLEFALEGGDSLELPGFSVFSNDSAFIDLYNTGNGVVYWSSKVSAEWIKPCEESGVVYDEKRIWINIDWEKAPKGVEVDGQIMIYWSTSLRDEWSDWDNLSVEEREAYRGGITKAGGHDNSFEISLALFNPDSPAIGEISGFVESNGYISIEAEHFSRKKDFDAGWTVIEGLGRTGNSITVLPPTIKAISSTEEILSGSPSVEYDIHTFSEGEVSLQLNCSPGNPINAEYGQRVAVAIDGGVPQIISYERGNRDVMYNLMTLHADLNIEKAGSHVLKIWMVDPGIVIDKIIMDMGGLKESYLGPPESFQGPQNKMEKLAGGFSFTEGPAVDAKGNVYFTDIPNNMILIWTIDNRLDTFSLNSGGANGLYFDMDNNLIACEGEKGRITSTSPSGELTTIAGVYQGKRFNKTNDLWPDAKGGVYFTDPRYGGEGELPQDGEHVYYIKPGHKSVIRVCDDLIKPNGLIGTPDGKLLYVTDAQGGKTYKYDIQEDGSLRNKTLFVELGCDGMTIDESGNLYLTTNGKKAVDIFTPSGELLESIEVPEKPSNVCFGGEKRNQLFITARTSLYRIEL